MASRSWRSVRGRTTLGATVVVAVALLIGAFSFYGVLSASIHGSTERAAEQRLEELTERAGGPGGKSTAAAFPLMRRRRIFTGACAYG